MKKSNCWEVMRCGYEPGGSSSDEYVCPAATLEQFNGINGGTCAGRFCWWVVGTCCQGEVQGKIAKKILDCSKCSFFNQVVLEEERGFVREIDNVDEKKSK